MRDAEMRGVAVGPDRYVVVGCRGFDGSSTSGAAWSSTDGESWAASDVKDADDACLDDVISSPGRYLAWGHLSDRSHTSFWHSTDGDVWLRAPTTRTLADVDVAQVVHAGGRFVAFSLADPAESGAATRILVSPDGVRWSDQPAVDACAVGQTSDPVQLGAVRSVLVDGPEIVAIGSTLSEYLEPAPSAAPAIEVRVIGRSRDARCWTVTYVSTDETMFDYALTADGLVGVGRRPAEGSVGTLEIAASTSANGSAWMPSTFAPNADEGTLHLLAAGDSGMLTLGPVDDGEAVPDFGDSEAPEDLPPPGTELSAWWSAEGRTWTRVAAPVAPTTLFGDLVPVPGGFLVVGSHRDPTGDVTAETWIGR